MAVLLCINYSFRTYRYRMPKPLKTPRVSTPDRHGGFWTGGKSASRRALRSSLNPRPEDTAPAALCDAGLCKEKELDSRRRSERRGVWGNDTPPAGEAHRGCPTARDRSRPGLATGSLGTVAAGPGEHAPGTERTRRGIRVTLRSARPYYPERQSARRNAGSVCGVRARYFAGPREGGNRPSKKGWETAWAANDSRQARAGNEAASQQWAEQAGNRQAPRRQSHLRYPLARPSEALLAP